MLCYGVSIVFCKLLTVLLRDRTENALVHFVFVSLRPFYFIVNDLTHCPCDCGFFERVIVVITAVSNYIWMPQEPAEDDWLD